MENYKQIKTYEDALRILKRDHFDENNLYPREIARRKLEVIIEAMNEGWKPDWENYSELKWYPYFQEQTGGLGYSFPTYAIANCGGRLFCKSEEIADYIGRQFLYLYKEMLLG